MKDSTKRALRSGIDLILMILVSLTLALGVPGVSDLFDKMTRAGAFTTLTILILVLTTFFSKFKNQLEDSGTIPQLIDKGAVVPGEVTETKLTDDKVKTEVVADESEVEVAPDSDEGELATVDEEVPVEEQQMQAPSGPLPSPYRGDDFDGVQEDYK